jgi:hypothetical protein
MDRQAMALEELRAQRFAILRAVYDAAEGSSETHVKMLDVASSLGFDDELANKIVSYLEGERLLAWAAMGMIELTHQGVKEVEGRCPLPTVRPRTSLRSS